jgi:hypothetical protein
MPRGGPRHDFRKSGVGARGSAEEKFSANETGGLSLKRVNECADLPGMDGRAIFQSVLNPREKLLWIGEPPFTSGRRLGAVAIGLLFVFTVSLFLKGAPIPPHMGFQRTAGLVLGVALFFTIPFSLIWFWSAGRPDQSITLSPISGCL